MAIPDPKKGISNGTLFLIFGLFRVKSEFLSDTFMIRQKLLPGCPVGANKIGSSLSILETDNCVTYFLGGDNYFSHPSGDEKARRFALASLMINSHVRARDLEEEPLLIPHRTLMNWVKQHRTDGPSSFFQIADTVKPHVVTEEKRIECARLLAQGLKLSEVARQVGIDASTLRKANKRKPFPTLPPESINSSTSIDSGDSTVTTKSERSRADAATSQAMGVACTRADERVAATMGLVECATSRFEAACDVPMAGLLAGLPALCANGLFIGIGRHMTLPKGFYSVLHILLTLGFMALARIRRPEGLRHIPPGEFGKVIGLDRVPEVRTLREKVSIMAQSGNPEAWMKELSRFWMECEPEEAGYLYIDGHVRVYNGEKADLPRRFVSREKLCLRGTTDYWINDALGRPFFVVSKAITSGLADCLLNDIVPELLISVPKQPTELELEQDPLLHRFVMIFDREGSSYELFSGLWKNRIGAISYRKNVKDVWPETEFTLQEVPVPGGGNTVMKLALRESKLSSGSKSMPVIEVRRLTDTGHQTSIITSAQRLGNLVIAGRMFARWCQENFFAYMIQHYDLDGLVEYGVEEVPGTKLVVNPKWRDLDFTVKKTLHEKRKLQIALGKLAEKDNKAESKIDSETDSTSDAKVAISKASKAANKKESLLVQKKAELVESIQAVQKELEKLRAERRTTARKVTVGSLTKEEQPTQLPPLNKMLTDTIKMIAYRAETGLVATLRKYLNNEDEARALIRQLFVSAGDIEPCKKTNTLTIKIHRMTSPVQDKAIENLLEELTRMEFCHPETGAKLIYSLV